MAQLDHATVGGEQSIGERDRAVSGSHRSVGASTVAIAGTRTEAGAAGDGGTNTTDIREALWATPLATAGCATRAIP